MSRLIALPFAVLLGVLSFGLIASGVAVLQEASSGGERREASFLDIAAFSEDNDEADESSAIAGASLLGFGVLGFIGAVALLIMSLTGDRAGDRGAVPQQQQQQQQVVVHAGPDARIERRD